MPEPKKRRHGFRIFLGILILLEAAVILAVQFQKISDIYAGEIVPRLSTAIGGFISRILTAVCEICVAAGICLGTLLLMMLILLIFLRKHEKYRKVTLCGVRIALVIAVLAAGGELRYNTVRRTSSPVWTPQTHEFDELTALWNYTITQINTLSTQVDRDENYHLIRRSDEEIRAVIDASRRKLSAQFPRFALAEPPVPKTSVFSAVVTKFGDSAYYIEPWHETVFTIRTQNRSYYPATYAHEYSHYSGYYREDEANLFGLLLCTESDDLNIQYAAWLDIMNRVWNAVEKEYFGTDDPTPAQLDDPAYQEYCAATVDYDLWLTVGDRSGDYTMFHQERGEENVVDERRPEPELPEAAANIVQKQGERHFTNLKKELGAHYYDGVVQLMLDYYADRLEPFKPDNLKSEKG